MTSNDLDLDGLVEFAQQIHGQATEQDTIERVLAFALTAVGADYAGVVVPTKADGLETVAATDPVVATIEAGGLPAEAGIGSVLSARLYDGDQGFGTLNVYAKERDAFTAEDESVLHAVARLAAIAVSSTRKEQNLWRAIDSRKLVGQAQGILMERFDLDPDEAFAVLVRYSQTQNVKVVAIAEELVRTRLLPSPKSD